MRLPRASRRRTSEAGDRRGPILVLSSGHRCGSTLIQRVLASHPDVHIWGEHNGALVHVLEALYALEWWSRNQAEDSRAEFARRGYRGWIPNLTPDEDAIHDAVRSFVRTLFADSADATWWGFKEVRYGGHAAQVIRKLFPDTRVVHVTRDPRDVLRSLTSLAAAGDWDLSAIPESLNLWEYVNRSLLDISDPGWILSVRLEDVIAEPTDFTTRLAAFIGLDPNEFDPGVFESQVRWSTSGGKPLGPAPEPDPELAARLASPEMVELAASYGYDIGGARG